MPFANCYADAGYGSSYGGSYGGGSYGGGSYGGGYDGGFDFNFGGSSGYSSRGDAGPYSVVYAVLSFITAGAIIFAMFFVVSYIHIKTIKSVRKEKVEKKKFMTQEEIDKIDSSIIIKDINKYAFDLYCKEQKAWMNFDYEGLRDVVGDELFNSYKMQLETAKMNNEQNIVENIKMIYDGGVISINKDDTSEEVKLQLHVRLTDYIIDIKTKEVKYGTSNRRLENVYIITLKKSLKDEIEKCPECGASINDKATQECKRCGAVLVKGSKDFVIIKQESMNKE